jgi:hypothetical protein
MALKKSQRARDRVSEEIALEHIHEFFVEKKVQEIEKEGERMTVSLKAINPKRNLMEDFRSLFIRTKIFSGEYKSKLVKLASTIMEMSVTPDLALIMQVIVMRGPFLDEEKTKFQVALVEVKRGNAKMSSDQKEDVEIAKNHDIPYYLLRIDDSNFMDGRFSLRLEPLTPSLLLTVPKVVNI